MGLSAMGFHMTLVTIGLTVALILATLSAMGSARTVLNPIISAATTSKAIILAVMSVAAIASAQTDSARTDQTQGASCSSVSEQVDQTQDVLSTTSLAATVSVQKVSTAMKLNPVASKKTGLVATASAATFSEQMCS